LHNLQVNEQYIKPVTAEAGKMSWALMRNPDGLDCDLFVSDWVVFDGSPVRNSADLSCGCAAERKVC